MIDEGLHGLRIMIPLMRTTKRFTNLVIRENCNDVLCYLVPTRVAMVGDWLDNA